ncbi:unnamed protein product [Rotaria sp. Silwood2]|nr:unnamed protein product [Rotaria sp. Silwood2]
MQITQLNTKWIYIKEHGKFTKTNDYYAPPCCYPQEDCIDEPIYIKRRHRRHRRRCRSVTPIPDQLPPIIIPFPVPEPAPPQLQITEYVQDIYPPAQFYTDQVPVGYVAKNTIFQKPGQIQKTESLDCQPGIILPPSPCIQSQQQVIQKIPSGQCVQQQIIQQLPNGQCVQRPLSICGGGFQTVIAPQQPIVSPSNSIGLMNSCPSGAQWIS